MTDESLFQDFLCRIRAGDAAAAEELVRRYETTIRVAVRVRLSDPALRRHFDSMDVCQSVLASFFVRAAAGQFDLEGPKDLIGLLVRMAQNKMAMQARYHHSQKRDSRKDAGADAMEGLRGDEPGPERVVAGRELLEAVRGRLGDEERRLADLRGQGRSWPEIAAEVGGNVEAVRKRLTRALDRVAAELGLDSGEGLGEEGE